jgi:Flp pilus assembly protein TadD
MAKRNSDGSARLVHAVIFVAVMAACASLIVRLVSNKNRVTSLYLTKASAALQHDRFDEAVDALRKAGEADPSNTETQKELLKARLFKLVTKYDVLDNQVDSERVASARADCGRLLESNPKNAELTALSGLVDALNDQPALAIEKYQRSVELDPSYPNARNYWGYTAYQWKYPENWREVASEKFNEAIQLDSSYAMPRINLALLSVLSGEFQMADAILSDTAQIAKDNTTLYVLWGACLVEWGKEIEPRFEMEAERKYFGALDRFKIVEALDPKIADLHHNEGVALERLGREGAASAEYKKAILLEPDFLKAHEALGLLLYRTGDFNGALLEAKEYRRIVENLVSQFRTRMERTPDEHARKLLGQWISDKAKDKKDTDAIILELERKVRARPKTAD